jgi:hypothetical protein
MSEKLLPSHDNTSVSKLNRAIEEKLMKDINGIIELIRREVNKSREPNTNSQQVDEIVALRVVITNFYNRVKPIIEPDIYSLFREAATKSYQLGLEYSAKTFKTPGYITESDIGIIKQIVDQAVIRFWFRTQQAILGTQQYYRLNKQEPATSKVNPNYIANVLAIDVTTKALNAAVVKKGRVLQ